MLFVETGDQFRVITQSDHARLAHDILSLWRGDGLDTDPLRDELLFAAAEHDNGWREADSSPMLHGTSGRPCDFRDFPAAERRRVWELGVRRHLEDRPIAAFLILLHATRILTEQRLDPDWETFFERLAVVQDGLLDRLGEQSSAIAELYEFLWLADSLSLKACGAGNERSLIWKQYEASARSGHIVIEPFPFAGTTRLRVPCRYLTKERFSGDRDLGSALAEAHWRFLDVSIEALQSA